MSAARTTDWVTAPVSTMPLPRVAATSVEMSAPKMLATAAIARATVGLSARVEMDVAIAFAESWKPFVKSKRSAVAITTKSKLALKEPPRSPRRAEDATAGTRAVRRIYRHAPGRGGYRRTAATALPASAKSAPAPTRLMVLRTLMALCSARITPSPRGNCHRVIPDTCPWTVGRVTGKISRAAGIGDGCRDSPVSLSHRAPAAVPPPPRRGPSAAP